LKGRTFADFCASRERIPTNLLSDRLRKLVGLGLLDKVPYQDRPLRYEYIPTERGKALKPMLRAMKAFGEQHLDGHTKA
jgi:DNA-binding HxlR family transcriptional regulator